MEIPNGAKDSTPQSHSERIKNAFEALPALGTTEYIEYVRTASKDLLPPEVLARAYRQLPSGCQAADATLERLFRRKAGGKWEYLWPLIACAREQYRRSASKGSEDYEDLLQDGVRKILETLPTPRGAFAERGWYTFCRHEFIDAWRKKHGRRGERQVDERPAESEEVESRFSRRNLKPDQVVKIEQIALRVLCELKDEYVRAVAAAVWFESERPEFSRSAGTTRRWEELATSFPGKNRFHRRRAVRYADAQLAAALLEEPYLDLEPHLQPVLEKLVRAASQPPRRANGR
jgi:hypothetical protein